MMIRTGPKGPIIVRPMKQGRTQEGKRRMDPLWSTSLPLPLVCWLLVLSIVIVGCSVVDAASFQETTRISYVIESFESMGTPDGTDLWTWMNPDAVFKLTKKNKLHGKYAVMVEYDTTSSSDGDVAAPIDFGWIQSDRPHNCYGADTISMWAKLMSPEDAGTADSAAAIDGGNSTLTVTLYNDLQCTILNRGLGGDADSTLNCSLPENLDALVVLEHSFDVDTETDQWLELAMNVSTLPESFDVRRIRGWKMELMGKGIVIVDQLTCSGDGHIMMGAAFAHPFHDMDLAVEEHSWMEEYYLSERAANYTKRTLRMEKDKDGGETGVLSTRYMVEQKEAWGGYSDWAHLAPGNSYYNLSGATDLVLDYNVTRGASIKERSIFRLVVIDSSDCVQDCATDKQFANERWYSFHSILDKVGDGQIVLPLQGSVDVADPFWLTGWSGIMGNSQLDVEYIKGFDLEVVLDSALDIGTVVTGGIEFSHMRAMTRDMNGTDGTDQGREGEPQCVVEEGLFLDENSAGFYRLVEFLGAVCCETCMEDPDCLYALSTGRDCLLASVVKPESVGILNSLIQVESLTVYWMDDVAKRGDFCQVCECSAEEQSIDCRGKDLLVVPKSFTPRTDGWMPKSLDLTDNPHLVLIGKGSLDSIAKGLESLALPASLRHLSPIVLENLPKLTHVEFEGDGQMEHHLVNAIVSTSDFFADVCCGLGEEVAVDDGITADQQTFSFCDMQISLPGIDSTYEPFMNNVIPTIVQEVTPSSSFMAEAAESVEKCAEYCALNEECNFFTYDQRLPNAEPICMLQSDPGPKTVKVCCAKDHYADEAQTIPGIISGRPPRTRHELDNARVLLSQQQLSLNPQNEFQTSFEVSLGSTPIRGAVWVEPVFVGQQESLLNLTISPPRVALYNVNQTATILVTLSDVQSGAQEGILLIQNRITSCDEAFSMFPDSNETSIFVTLTSPTGGGSINLAVAIAVPVATLVLIGLCIFFFYEHKRKENESLWKVNQEDIKFADPPEIIGRGTFGLVLLGEYRGTQVAVKRVIPPRSEGKGTMSSGLNSGSHTPSHERDVDDPSETERAGNDTKSTRVDMTGLASTMSSKRGINNGGDSTTSSSDRDNKTAKNSGSPFDLKTSSWAELRLPTMSGSVSPGLRSIEFAPSNKNKSITSILKRTAYKSADWRQRKNDFVQEMMVLSKLRHPNVTTVMGAVIGNNVEPLLVMEYMQLGSLYDILHNDTMVLDGEMLLPILRDISLGIRFLHSAKPQIIHGDLKAHNILVDTNFRAKVSDFGLSQRRNMGGTGTPFWMAPELLRGESQNNAKTDVYSFGIILYEVYSRKDPYEGEDPMEVLRLVADRNVAKRPPTPDGCPSHVQSLMSDCLVDDAEQRPMFDEIDTRLRRIDSVQAEPRPSLSAFKNFIPDGPAGVNSTISLFDIFPEHIARALQEGRAVEAEHKECVTIFFSDIIGFTTLASTMDPRKVADMITRLYNKLDALTQEHDIFKVETVGDAYMATSNLVKDQESDHAKRIADFAIDAVMAANETLIDTDNESLGYVNIRVGFHSGPVVADVVGARNPRYCLFGDAVNTASRMESNSKANRIHCSEASANLLQEQYPTLKLKSRGMISIKGKGQMHTYWVDDAGGRKSSLLASDSDHTAAQQAMLRYLVAEEDNAAQGDSPGGLPTWDEDSNCLSEDFDVIKESAPHASPGRSSLHIANGSSSPARTEDTCSTDTSLSDGTNNPSTEEEPTPSSVVTPSVSAAINTTASMAASTEVNVVVADMV